LSYLLDTCVISEFARQQPAPSVVSWLDEQVEESLYTSVVVLGEISRGVALLAEGPKQRQLQAWAVTDLEQRFAGRILDVTPEVARTWGRAAGEARRQGIQIGMADGLIGATAVVHALTVVTRNVDDLRATGAAVLNPWSDV
jgi:predicted nucleic acid-binding protein